MMTRSLAAVIVAVSLGLAGCKDKPPPLKATATATATAPTASEPDTPFLVDDSPPSVSPESAMSSFLGQFEQYDRVLKGDPNNWFIAKAALGAYRARVTFLGQISALDRVIELGESMVAANPKRADAFIQRASAYGSVHRFADAMADLDTAKKLGADEHDLALPRATLLAALGRYDEALPLFVSRTKLFANHTHLGLEAMCRGRMLQFDKADELFAQADRKVRDGSPFLLAWLAFERASMWDRAGHHARAQALWRRAVQRLPQFAHAAGHLALVMPPEEGRQLLQRIMLTSDDPEYRAYLGIIDNKLLLMPRSALLQQGRCQLRCHRTVPGATGRC